MKLMNWMMGACAAAVMTAASAGFADENRDQAKKVLADNQNAVVSVSAVLKLEAEGQTQEQPLELFGTVLDEKGLTVVSATMLDPLSAVSDAVKAAAGDKFPKSVTTKIKIMLADGTEVAARTVFQDPDLDLAFLMPEKTDKPLPAFDHIKVGEAGPDADVTDRLIGLMRLPKNLDRKVAVGFCDVIAKLTKPRTLYLVDGFSTKPGMPLFRLDGTVAGIFSIRKDEGGSSMGRGGLSVGGAPVILPMKYVIRDMEQARAAKVEEKKAEEPKAEEKKADAPEAK